MPKTYFTYLPAVEGSLEEEFKLCLDQIKNTCSEGYIPVKLNVFVDLPDFESFLKTRAKIGSAFCNSFGQGCPACNVTVQPPEKPWKVAIEATFTEAGAYDLQMKRHLDLPYVIIESDTGKELWAAGVSSYAYTDDTRKAAEKAFDLMNEILAAEQMTLNNVVRQWNYIGEILRTGDNFQNYQVFNEVRNDYYSRFRKIKGYPAATGVGMMHGGVILDFCALRPGHSTSVIPVDNPHQLNAYNYGQQVLKGANAAGNVVKHPPQFERALLIANRKEAFLHISGTASILGQKTVGKNDIEKQTLVTIDNMESLADSVRLNKLMTGSPLSGSRFSLLRVYIKRDDDFSGVRQICRKSFPDVPTVFIRADICRDDLLMEVEAEVILEF
jgi:hypothetical protein